MAANLACVCAAGQSEPRALRGDADAAALRPGPAVAPLGPTARHPLLQYVALEGHVRVLRQGTVSPELFEGLLMLQHRGQDSAGMVTTSGRKFFEHKDNGLVNDVFSGRTMAKLEGALLGPAQL